MEWLESGGRFLEFPRRIPIRRGNACETNPRGSAPNTESVRPGLKSPPDDRGFRAGSGSAAETPVHGIGIGIWPPATPTGATKEFLHKTKITKAFLHKLAPAPKRGNPRPRDRDSLSAAGQSDGSHEGVPAQNKIKKAFLHKLAPAPGPDQARKHPRKLPRRVRIKR